MRAPGSGLYREVAVAAEELWAAVLVGSRARMFDWSAEIDRLYATGQSGLQGSVIQDWFLALAMGLGLSVRSARREDPDVLGDASAELADGTRLWFELKTQTQKPAFNDMTQADWVRDATTATAWLCNHERGAAGAVSAAALRELRSPAVPTGWTFEDAWLGDLLLLTDEAKRRAAGVVDRAGLAGFAERKYLVHTTQAGARVIRMTDLSPVAAILGGSAAHRDVHHGVGAAVGVWITAGRYPTRSDIHFSYNMDYGGSVLGRHKLHGAPLARDPWIVSGRAVRVPAVLPTPISIPASAAPPPPPPAPANAPAAPAIVWVPESSVDPSALAPGQRVRHKSRGMGRIRNVHLVASGAEVAVEFDSGGEGTFATGYGTLAFAEAE